MKSRIAKLLVVLMLMALPVGAVSVFSGTQFWDIDSDGSWVVLVYDYDTGALVYEFGAGNDFIEYPLPFGAWYGFFLYDIEDGLWEEAIYLYDESL